MSNNIYKKLAEMRVELQNCDIKKSGYNEYGKYNYYEMADFLPYINEIAKNHNVFNLYELQAEKAILKVMDLPSLFVPSFCVYKKAKREY